MSLSSRAWPVVALIAVLLMPSTARADAIDGDWCFGADHMHIEGSAILTPGRNKITGEYNRYRFAYVVPANEPGAGGQVRMVMIRGTETVEVDRPGGDPAKPEVWKRCKPIS